jgi:pilus assembly protein Flp/PilA
LRGANEGTAFEGGGSMKRLIKISERFLRDQDGPTSVEYAVLLALILMLCFVTIGAVGTKVSDTFAYLDNNVTVQ